MSNTSCDYCNSCISCISCNSCNSCDCCNYSKNLKMSEYQIFCWSEKYNDSFSKHQKDFRIFNKPVDKTTYHQRIFEIQKIIPNSQKWTLADFWKSLTDEQISELSKIPEFDAKGFEYITGRKVEKTEIEKAIDLLTASGLLVDGKILK